MHATPATLGDSRRFLRSPGINCTIIVHDDDTRPTILHENKDIRCSQRRNNGRANEGEREQRHLREVNNLQFSSEKRESSDEKEKPKEKGRKKSMQTVYVSGCIPVSRSMAIGNTYLILSNMFDAHRLRVRERSREKIRKMRMNMVSLCSTKAPSEIRDISALRTYDYVEWHTRKTKVPSHRQAARQSASIFHIGSD